MSSTVALLLVVMLAGPSDPPRRRVITPEPRTAEQELTAPEAPATTSDEARLRRFAGALAGSIVGFAATVALIPAFDGGPTCARASCRLEVAQYTLGALAPLVAATGAWAGFQLFGGNGGWLTALAATAPSMILGVALLAVGQAAQFQTVAEFLPLLIVSGAVLAGSTALALHLRSTQLDALGDAAERGSASAGRVALTSLVSIGGLALAGGFAALSWFSAGRTTALAGVLATASGLIGVAGTAAALYSVHRALGGKGTLLAALAGLGAIGVTLGAGFGLSALAGSGPSSPIPLDVGNLLSTEVLVFALLFAPVVALELSHTVNVSASLPRVSLHGAVMSGGAMAGATIRF